MKKENIKVLEKQQKIIKDISETRGIKKAKSFATDFKSFATKGNVMDMAVGVIIATAFTKIVNSLVNDIISPILTVFTGKIDFANLFIALDMKKYGSIAEAQAANVSVINYGTFIENTIDFLMVALILFMILRYIFKKNRKSEAVQETTTKTCPHCLNEIPSKATKCGYCTSELKEKI